MIVIGTTIAAFAMSEPDAWSAWLKRALAHKASHPAGVRHFAAIQIDARGIEPFEPLLEQLDVLGGEYWTYSLDDGRDHIGMTNRWRHITVGQNLVTDYCQADPDVSHLLFLAADCSPNSDVIPRMLEMDHPLVAPFVPTYGLRGPVPTVPDWERILDYSNGVPAVPRDHNDPKWHKPRYPYPVEEAMASAAAIFIARDVFRRIRWRWDLDAGMSDDPCYEHDARTLLGIPTYVRHDCTARHYPESVGPYETRFDPAALEVHR